MQLSKYASLFCLFGISSLTTQDAFAFQGRKQPRAFHQHRTHVSNRRNLLKYESQHDTSVISPSTGIKNRDQRRAEDEAYTSLSLFKFSSSSAQEETTLVQEDEPESPSFGFNPLFAIGWVALTVWAFGPFAPGELGSAGDTALLNQILVNPANPGINELFYSVFNAFAIVPILLSALALPQAPSNKGLPAGPFLAASSAIGYFAFGPYLIFKPDPITDMTEKTQISWFTSKVLENKLFNGLLLVFTTYLCFIGTNVVTAYQQDSTTLIQGFLDILTTSRFAAVSLFDLMLLYGSCIALTPQDYLIRKPDATKQEAKLVALASALVPYIGSVIYLIARPKLAIDNEEE